MRVIDASALVDVLVRSPRGKRVAAELDGFAWIAPELVDVEALSVLARLTRGGYLTVRHASAAAAALAAMPMRRISHAPLLPIAWTLRERVRVADGFYVACARMVGVPLLTTDRRLAAAPVPDVSVLVVH